MKYLLLFVLLILVILFVFDKITNSRFYRIRSAIIAQRKREELSDKKFNEKIKSGVELINDKEKLIVILEKIQNGEEVEIPLVAFDYIYRNINKFGVFDKKGKLVIVNKEQYLEFQNTALRLLDTAKQIENEQENQIEEDENDELEFSMSNQIQKFQDGTIMRKDQATQTTFIAKQNGKKYIINDETNQLIIQTPKKDNKQFLEKNNQKSNTEVNAIKAKENQTEINKLKTQINVMESYFDEFVNSKNQPQTSSNLVNAIELDQDIEDEEKSQNIKINSYVNETENETSTKQK